MPRGNLDQKLGNANRDLVALGIAAAAILLFVATGGSVFPSAINALYFGGAGPDHLLVNALLLNVVLIIFGWRRYRELQSEISERRIAEQRARELAETDPLTGCLNRRSISDITDRMREQAREQNMAIAYCMLDLDNFKTINDMHGHSVGDAVLVEMARRLNALLPENAYLARLGGDEFALAISYDPARKSSVDEIVQRLFEVMARPFEHEGHNLDATISIGIGSDHDHDGFNEQWAAPEKLMQHADMAMYNAKKQGKNRYFWFEPSMENELRFRNELETGIRRGLANGEFVPFYEQQINLETGELAGFEMLARWRSEQLGMVSPELFIPIAEEIGLIAEISNQLIEQALVDASAWDEKLTLAINISPVQMRDPWFAQKFLKMLVKHNFPAHRIEVEITESCLHDNLNLAHLHISSLRNQGVQISLDDFGTGYSSLEQLRNLPFDRLKIDRSFVTELNASNNDSKFVDAIVSLGHGLDLPITAEGIEDEETLQSLRRMGNFKGQGYYFGRPEDAQNVIKRLKELNKLSEEDTSEHHFRKIAKNGENDPIESNIVQYAQK